MEVEYWFAVLIVYSVLGMESLLVLKAYGKFDRFDLDKVCVGGDVEA